tara:strand:- start:1678 stop:2493 length:816 start_codon:yes stop_codon:yes gene_type:complete
MRFNILKFLKEYLLLFITINLLILISSFFFVNQINKGIKYEIQLGVNINAEISNKLNSTESLNLYHDEIYRELIRDILSNQYNENLAVSYKFDEDILILNFFTYDKNINKNNLIKYIQRFQNNFNKKINTKIFEINEYHFKILNDKIKSSLSFLSNKNIFVEVLETIGSIDLIDKVLIKELLDKEQYILIDAIQIVQISEDINDIDKINLFITNNQFYKFTEFSKDDFIETNIYFKNFEIVFIFFMLPISFVGSFILFLLINYKRLYRYID